MQDSDGSPEEAQVHVHRQMSSEQIDFGDSP